MASALDIMENGFHKLDDKVTPNSEGQKRHRNNGIQNYKMQQSVHSILFFVHIEAACVSIFM